MTTIKEEYEKKFDIIIQEYKGLYKETIIKCIKCETIHNNVKPFNYGRRKTRCCENGKKFTPISKRIKIDGRDTQVNFEKVKSMLEENCKNKDGECLNVDEYKNHQTNLKFKCNVCKYEWNATYNNIINKGSWCPNCVTKQDSEKKCKVILEYLTNKEFIKVRPRWLATENLGHYLELDCFNEELKLALEYNGIQHYEPDMFLHRPKNYKQLTIDEIKNECKKNLEKQIKKDNFKYEKCKENGIKLIIISYLDARNGFSYIKKKIYNEIKEFVEKEPDKEWLESNSAGMNIDAPAKQRKLDLLKYIEDHAKGYKIKNPDIIIEGFRHKFILICPNNHEYTTYLDNFKNRKRRCKWCAMQKNK